MDARDRNAECRLTPQGGGRGAFLRGAAEARGHDYGKLRRSVCIVVTDFVVLPEVADAHTRFRLHDAEHDVEFTDMIELHILELPKLEALGDLAVTGWVRLFNSTTRREIMEAVRIHPELSGAADAILELSEDESMRWLEESREKARRDAADREAGARAEGEWNRAVKVARSLLGAGMDPGFVSQHADLPLDAVLRLAEEIRG